MVFGFIIDPAGKGSTHVDGSKKTQTGNVKNVRNVSPSHLNVDIMYSLVGGREPPTLPLREEMLTQGVELVYNAKGVGQTAVCKEQKRREAQLLKRLKEIETKMEKKRSYRRTQKRIAALETIRQLRIKLENSASGISYEMYLDELRRLLALRNTEEKDAITSGHSNAVESNSLHSSKVGDDIINMDGSFNTLHIEEQIMSALEDFNDSEFDFDMSDDESMALTNETNEDSFLSEHTSSTVGITDKSMDTVRMDLNGDYRKNASMGEKRDDEIRSSLRKGAAIDGGASISNFTQYTTTSCTTAPTTNKTGEYIKRQGSDDTASSRHSIVKSPSSCSVRFKDVKPSVEDNLARARALIENARIVHRSFSNDSNCSSIKPSESYKKARASAVKEEEYSPDSGRFHLFVSHACSWSHRCLVVRTLKGLESVIGASFVKCSWASQPLWDTTFVSNPENDVSFWAIEPSSDIANDNDDEVFQDFQSSYLDMRDIKTRVPILWDKNAKRVIASTSTEIMKKLNFDFNKWAQRPKLNIYPFGSKVEREKINRWLHDAIIIGIYRCGLATSQFQYDEAIDNLTSSLDKADKIVQSHGFLTGDKLTESDIRLFVILMRLDEIYRVLFNTNTKRITCTPGLLEYVKDIYQIKGIKEVCNMTEMKKEYFGAKAEGDFIIPRGGMFMKMLEEEQTPTPAPVLRL